LTLTAEQNPSGALSLLYEVYDATDSQSPLASKDATLLTFVGSGTASQTVANPNDSITIITASSGVHSWIIRCTASTPAGPAVYERMVSMRTATAPAVRKTVSVETGQYEAREFHDTLNDMVDVLGSGLPASVTIRKNTGANIGTRPRLNFIEGANITMTIADDAPGTEVDITINAPAATGNWQRAGSTLSPVIAGDDVQLTSGGIITTDSANDLSIIPDTSGITIIGNAGATSHGLNDNDSLFVSNRIEVDGIAYFDGTTAFDATVFINDDKLLAFGTPGDSVIQHNTTQTVDTLFVGLSADSRHIVFAEFADYGFDFSHAQATDPTVFIHSANQATDEWISLAHDQTDGIIDVGTGDIKVGSNLDLDTGGLKDNDVTVAIALGDALNTALDTTNLTLVGGINELEARIDTGPIVNGAVIEDHSIAVTSDGATVTLALEKSGGGDLNLIFDGGLTFFDATPAATIALTAGSDTSPTLNYVYIPKSTGVLTKSTTAFDDTEQIVHIATVLVQSAGGVQTDGCYKCHAWTDHLVNGLDRGHVTHINEWIRKRQATWENGVALTPTVGVATFDVATSSGNVFQLHRHAFPAFDTSTGSDIFVVNDSVTPFKKVGDLTGELTDSTGVSMSGKHFSLVIWGVQSETGSDCKLMCNLPGGSYNASSQADLDANKYADFTIPDDFRGAGFLIARLVVQHAAGGGGTWSLTRNEDLRGQLPQTGAGGATAQSTTFPDNTFIIFDEGDNTKEIAFQASGITTGTTRTLTVQDVDGTIALTTVADDLAFSFGTSNDTVLEFDTGQTVDALLFALDATSRSVVIIEEGDRGFDFAHGAQTNPTVFVHSANQATDEWISLTHNQTDAVIDTGSGTIKLDDNVKIEGYIQLIDVAAPGAPGAGIGRLYKKTGDDGVFWMPDAAGPEVDLTTSGNLDDGYNNHGGAATVTVDAGDITLDLNGAYSLVLDLDGVPESGVDGFLIENPADSDYFRVVKASPPASLSFNTQLKDADLNTDEDFDITAGGAINLSSTGKINVSGDLEMQDDTDLGFGNASDATLTYNTTQTVDTLVLGVSAESNGMIVCQKGDTGFDFAHALETDPTLFVHSANQATDEWISISHDQTNSVINSGKGALSIGGQVSGHALTSNGDLIINNLEANGVSFFDAKVRVVHNSQLTFGSGDNAHFEYDTGQTNDALLLGVSTASRTLIVHESGDQGTNWGFPVKTDPTIFIVSSDAGDTTQWLSLAHDQTDGVIDVGSGSIKLDAAVILGGDLDLNQNYIELDPTPTSDDTANGEIITDQVDVNSFGQWAALHIDTDGNWIDAHADAAADMPCMALAIESGTGSKKLLLRGFARNDAWNWTQGGAIYVSPGTSGGLTQTAPGSGEFQQIVGFAKSADVIYFSPSPDVVEVA
jgi:hypothetical protein